MRTAYCLLLLLLLTAAACSHRPTRLFMAGDSTMADKSAYITVTDSVTGESHQVKNPERGWGQVLPGALKHKVDIHNHARNGRSTRTFIGEGRWQALVDSLQEGDFVVIQFGHNDQSPEKVDRYTSPEDYKRNLERFVLEVRAQGAVPVLCTPVMRRRFDTLGNFYDVHGVYPGLVRQVAEEQQALLVDMHRSTERLLREYGAERSKALFTDNTHFSGQGATIVAALFVDELQRNHPDLALINH